MEDNIDSKSVKQLKEKLFTRLHIVILNINELDSLIESLDKQLDKEQPLFIGRGRVRLEAGYYKFMKQIKLKNTDKWIFLRIPSDHLIKRINKDCINDITKPIFNKLIHLITERNKLYKYIY
ncbi:MAG: hypothetical protein K2P99_07040, partial [Burkholderiales bacterium]|nr:hypothetical protein [Burkholderiales bacterium]